MSFVRELIDCIEALNRPAVSGPGSLLTSLLVGASFTRSVIDPCLYMYSGADGHVLWALIYVDDGLLVDSPSWWSVPKEYIRKILKDKYSHISHT